MRFKIGDVIRKENGNLYEVVRFNSLEYKVNCLNGAFYDWVTQYLVEESCVIDEPARLKKRVPR